MPHPHSNYIERAIWDDPKKVASRKHAIIDTYREHFGRALNIDRQYWTMCGAYYGEQSILHGELGQLLEEGLIQPIQFHGVDRVESIIEYNKSLYPNVKWHNGDFLDTMEDAAINNTFNPAIINYDGVMQPEYGTKYLKGILKLIDFEVENEMLLVTNFVLKSPYKYDKLPQYEPNDVIDELKRIYTFPDHWWIKPYAYVYDGTGNRSHSQMGMLMFIKEKHDINHIKHTQKREITERRIYGTECI